MGMPSFLVHKTPGVLAAGALVTIGVAGSLADEPELPATAVGTPAAPIESPWRWYEGLWRLEYTDAELGTVGGWARIGLTPRHDDAPRFVEMVIEDPSSGATASTRGEAWINEDGELELTVASVGPASGAVGEGSGDVQVLHIPKGPIEVSIDGYAEDGTVASMLASEKISITFPVPADGAIESLTGVWRYGVQAKSDMVRGRAGDFNEADKIVSGPERWWRPPPEIALVAPLDQPHPSELVGGADGAVASGVAETHATPAPGGDPQDRCKLRPVHGDDAFGAIWLSLAGDNLPVQPRREIDVQIPDMAVVPTGALRANPKYPSALDVCVVLKSGLTDTPKRVRLNEAEAVWAPEVEDLEPTSIQFLRQANAGEFEVLSRIRHGEVFHVEATYPAAPYAPRQTYLAVPGKDEAGATPVQVTRVSGHPNLYRSPRLVMLAPGHKPPSAGQIEQKTDADIEAEPPVPVRAPAGMRLRVGPAREGAEAPMLRSNAIAGIDVVGHPPDSLWEKALARAKECRRKEGSETEFTNYILTNLVVPGESVAQSVPIGVEDHAAAILLRDELVQALDEWIEKQNARSPVDPDAPPDERRRQQRMWAAAQRVEAEALIDLASREGEHAFFAMKVTNQHGEPNAIYLGGALHKFDYEKEMLNRKGDWEDFVAYARKAIAEARGEVLGYAARSLERAREPNDCELREVLEVVGVGLDAVVQRLLPKLLRPRNANEPPYPEWVPDGAARAAVNSVHLTAQAVAAQEEYSSIDTDVAIAAATLGLTSAGYGVTLAGERAVAYGAARAAAAANRAAQSVRRALQATEALDVYAAYRDAEDWERAHADRAFGYGIASVAGGERLRQAWENERERRFGLAVNAAAASALPVVQGVGARAAGDDVVRLSTSPHQSAGTSSSPSAQRPSSPDATAGRAGRFPDAVPDNRVLDQSAAPSGASSPPVDPEADTVLNTRPRQGVRAGDTGRMQPPASPPSGEPSNLANVDPEGDIGPGAIEDSTPGIDEDFTVDLRTPEGRARLDSRVQAGLDEIERTRQLEDAPDTSPQPPRLPQDLLDRRGFKDLPARPRTGSPEMNEVLEGYKTPQERAADKAFITSETQELPVPPADTGASRKALETDPLPENAGTAHSGVRESRSPATSSGPRAKTEAREVESRPSAAPPSVEEFDPTASETDAATRPGAFAEPEVDEFDPTASSDIDTAAESYARNYANRRATERSRRQQQLAEVLARRERAPTFQPPEGERLRNPNVRWLVAGDAARLQALMRRYNSVQDRVYADTINDYAQQMINDEFEWSKIRPGDRVKLSPDGKTIVHGHHRMIAAELASQATGRPVHGGANPIIPEFGFDPPEPPVTVERGFQIAVRPGRKPTDSR